MAPTEEEEARKACELVERAPGEPRAPAPIPDTQPAAIAARRKRLALFVDLTNVTMTLKSGANDTIVVERIRAACKEFGVILLGFAFVDVTRTPHDLLRELDRERLFVINCPKQPNGGGGLRDTVDEHIIECIRAIIESGAADVIALASNDNDFIGILQHAKDRGVQTVLLVANPEGSSELRRIADQVRFVGSKFLVEVATCADAIRCSEAICPIPVEDEDGQPMPQDPKKVTDELNEIARQYPNAVLAFAEIIRYATRYERDGFALTFLASRCWSETEHRTPNIALPAEGVRCAYVLRELGCFAPLVGVAETDDQPRNRLVLNRKHPLVQYVLASAKR